ncbi:MAG: response regulator transcription factor [Xenococcaceae cyanobacterium MO_188.B32]|nr:response regulator transcription factor [Xenococcaceae cyanobacterium MO_188.B32]
MIDVLIVDDQKTIHTILESHLKTESNINIVGFAVNGQEAIDQISSLQPDVVLMDIEMPVMDGLAATKIITDRFVNTKVLILTVHDNDRHLNQSLQNGAKGYLLKTAPAEELINAIRQVHKGYFQLGLELVEKYIYKILKLESDIDEVSRLKQEVEIQSQNLEKINSQFVVVKQEIERETIKKVEKTLDRHKGFLINTDPNIQFEVDGISHRLKKLEKNVARVSKLQVICFLILLALATFSLLINL